MCSYEKEQARLRAILDELDSEEEYFGGEVSENEEDVEIRSEHDTETEQELDSDEENLDADSDVINNFKGKDGSIWRKTPFVQRRPRSENIFMVTSSLTDKSKNVETPQGSWQLFFSCVDLIVENTNIFIRKNQSKYKNVKHARITGSIEINSLLGLLYLCGLHKSSHVYVRDLWASDGTGLEIFNATMSYIRFQFLLRSIRFDNVETREERRKLDKLAPIREMFEHFNKNCDENYNVGCYVTVDEKLESFRGRCSFKQYIPNKPAKYGLKIFSAVDATTFYTSKLEIYCGQQPPGPFNLCNKPEQIVQRITRHLQFAGRNITTDNWFTTYPLAKDLLEKRTTLVGTVRKNKTFLPQLFTIAKGRELRSTTFGHQKNTTILSYVAKRNKCVLLLSTLHTGNNIISGPKMLPEIIHFYNKTKGGVDTTDQLCATYNVARNARRWPLVIFFCLLNVSSINARIVLLSTDNPPLQYKKRSLFIKDLAMSLIQAQIDRRSKIKRLNHNLKISCLKFATKNTNDQPASKKPKVEKQSRCQVCSYKSDRKTKKKCYQCDKFICGSHTITLCTQCHEPMGLPDPENSASFDEFQF